MLIHMNVFSYYVRVMALHLKKQCDLIHTIVDGDLGAEIFGLYINLEDGV